MDPLTQQRRSGNIWLVWLLLPLTSYGDPLSNPYIPYRTSPFDQDGVVHHEITFPIDDKKRSRIFHTGTTKHDHCPLHFSLGISKRWHDHMEGPDINHPPVIRTVFPAAGPGKQVIYLTQYEHLDLLSPAVYEHKEGRAVQEALVQAPQFPMLWESSSFHVSPILHDVNGDGITDVIVADYDGGISVMGLAQQPGQRRYFHHFQIPRLHVRRNWIQSRILKQANSTATTTEEGVDVIKDALHKDPYHSYFEYYLSNPDDENNNVLRGVTANVLNQEESAVKSLQARRSRTVSHLDDVKSVPDEHEEMDHAGMNVVDKDDGQNQTEHDNNNKDQQQPQKTEEQEKEHGTSKVDLAGELMRRFEDQRKKDNEENNHQAELRKQIMDQSGSKEEESNSKEEQSSNSAEEQINSTKEEDSTSQSETLRSELDRKFAESVVHKAHQTGENQHESAMDHDLPQSETKEKIETDPQQAKLAPIESGSDGNEAVSGKEELVPRTVGAAQDLSNPLDPNTTGSNSSEDMPNPEHPSEPSNVSQTLNSTIEMESLDLIHTKGQQNGTEESERIPDPDNQATKNESVLKLEEELIHSDGERTADKEKLGQSEAVDNPLVQDTENLRNQTEEKQTDSMNQALGEGNTEKNIEEASQEQRKGNEEPAETDAVKEQDLTQKTEEEEEKKLSNDEGKRDEGTDIVDETGVTTHRRRLADLLGDDMAAGGLADDGLLMDGHTGDDIYPDMPSDVDMNGAAAAAAANNKEERLVQEMEQMGRMDDELPPLDVTDDANYGRTVKDDDYHRYAGYDDHYGGYQHDDYYDDKHYIRIPPHVLCTPVLIEMPRLYGDNQVDDILLVVATYYFDEDEYEGRFSYKRFSGTDHGDETELKRGMYVASAILAYNFEHSGRWSSQSHLDLSTDFSAPENATLVGAVPIKADTTEMGAFAVASPTVADLDGDGTPDVLVGTSMGLLYALEGRNLFKRANWPIQMKNPIESRPLVEDVLGDTNLEVFVADIGGIVACFSNEAQLLWSRDILRSLGFGNSISGASPMSLGDVDGDGYLDLVLTVEVDGRWLIFAFQAASGNDLKNFPIELEKLHKPGKFKPKENPNKARVALPQPLLVDLHSNQDHLPDYIRRTSQAFQRDSTTKPTKGTTKSPVESLGEFPQGGSAPGLHIVQPLEKQLYIVEGGSGCMQKVGIGDEIGTMVQVDDIHGTNRLDLLVATKEGNVITLESPAKFHPLNTWSSGDMRGKSSHAHGYSASQGIFVHEVSRQYSDIFGVYVPITFEIFDHRPNIANEPDKKKYKVEIRDGTSAKRTLDTLEFTEPGVYTHRVYIRYGPGFYTICVIMTTSHGIAYEDCFATKYNVHFMAGFGVMLWLPLLIAFVVISLCGVSKKGTWEDEDGAEDEQEARDNRNLGILGRSLPT